MPFRLLPVVLLILLPGSLRAMPEAEALWQNRCEECHGEAAPFASKYLWNIGGELQGQHHIEDLHLFMRHHYIPAHALEAIRDMLLAEASSPLRYEAECGDCHGGAEDFVEQSIWVRGNEITGLGTGQDIREFLPDHRELPPDDVSFYIKLFARIAGKPIP